MRKYLLQLMGLALISIILYSCKLDKPILPGDPNYVAVTPPGGGGGGGITTPIDNASLTGKWIATRPFSYVVVSDGVIVNTTTDPTNNSLFISVTMDDAAKTATYENQFTLPDDEVSYVLSESGGKTYLQFSEDVFQRTSNGPVQILNFNGTTMTWLAVDPMVVTAAGHKVQSGYEVQLTKQ